MGRLGFRTELMGIIGNRIASAASERTQRVNERSDPTFSADAKTFRLDAKYETINALPVHLLRQVFL